MINVARLNQLLIDCDNVTALAKALAVIAMLRDTFPEMILKHETTGSRTPEHSHVIVTLANPIGDIERIALQLLCGSDWKHEFNNYCRVKNNAPWPILFIERKK